jgi:hypothetical protein
MSHSARQLSVQGSPRGEAASVDERVRLHGVPWADYQRLLEERRGPRLRNLNAGDGELHGLR